MDKYTVKFVSTFFLVAAATAGVAMTNPLVPSGTQSHVAVQLVLDQVVAQGEVPGILAEISDGDTTWFGTAGVANLKTGQKLLSQDELRIGSTTKTFTAMVMLQLAAEGVLTLDDSVEQWLPSVVQGGGHNGAAITIRQLLQHTSGIFNYVLDQNLMSKYVGRAFLEHRTDVFRPKQLVQIAMTHPPDFAPGTDWEYSNTNYILAGMIIERATGRTFAAEVSRRIARPLALTGTYMPTDATLHGPHGRLYSKLFLTEPNAKIYDVTEMSPSSAWTAGGMVSTATDLNRFFGALLSGELLPPAQQREMFTGAQTKNWIPNTTYGLGISSIRLSCGVTVWGHGGAITGSWSYVYGTRNGARMVSQHINGDWSDQIGTFTSILQAEFCPDAQVDAKKKR